MPSSPPSGPPQAPAAAGTPPASDAYVMRISRLTIDKLGVKLYDTVSAAVAELVANAYDADADEVTITTPLGVQLDGAQADGAQLIEVTDDGHGMTPDEARKFFLVVGRDRRRGSAGGLSRGKNRPVMGRKGIGKLAPFGICQRIEVISAGGPKTAKGYEITNFTMDFDRIVEDHESDVTFDPGPLDRTYRATPGTTMRLTRFLKKRVPPRDVLERQIGRRFAGAASAIKVTIRDPSGTAGLVPPFDVPMEDLAAVDLSTRPVEFNGKLLPVTGRIGMAKQSYRNEEMAGVRIYARGKLVATTRDFEQPAGFTGEFTTRSYLVGTVHAEWLDLDDGDDLVRTDRQGILWESDYGDALRQWGAKLIKEVGKKTAGPRRQKHRDAFLLRSDFEKRALKKFKDKGVVDAAMDLARKIGSFAAPDELEDDDYLNDLSEVILSVAPHKALMEALQEFSAKATSKKVTITQLANLFGKSRIAELAAYGQIAAERVRIIEELEDVIFAKPAHDEAALQKLISQAPWLIAPSWAAITSNQNLNNFTRSLQNYLSKKSKKAVTLTFGPSNKRPDFLLVSVGTMVHLVELKKVDHDFDDTDCKRLLPYFEWLDEFFATNKIVTAEYSRGYRIDLIADGVKVKQPGNKKSLKAYEEEGKYRRLSWHDFLTRAKNAHMQFLDARGVGKTGAV